MGKVQFGIHPVPSALDDLLATEAGIAERMADAEREAAELLAATHADAETRERGSAEALARELADLDERARVARKALVRAIEQDAARAVQRYQDLTESEIERLAAGAIAEATGLGPAGAS